MTDIRSVLNDLRRPGLLIRAARFGLGEYRRDRDLHRLLGTPRQPEPERALSRLLAEEERLEGERRSGHAGYSLCHHIEVLIALLAEARLIRSAGQTA